MAQLSIRLLVKFKWFYEVINHQENKGFIGFLIQNIYKQKEQVTDG